MSAWGIYFCGCFNLYCIFLVPCRYEENWRLLHVLIGCTLSLMGKEYQLSRLCFPIVPPEQSSSLDDKCMVILNNIVCHYQTVAPLSHSSLVPRPPLFLPSVCVHNNTRMWSSAPVYYCERKWKAKKGGGLGTRLVTLYIQAFVFVLCFSILSLS